MELVPAIFALQSLISPQTYNYSFFFCLDWLHLILRKFLTGIGSVPSVRTVSSPISIVFTILIVLSDIGKAMMLFFDRKKLTESGNAGPPLP